MTNGIREYYRVSERLATRTSHVGEATSPTVSLSGQPTPQEFAAIAEGGYRVVINLATSSSTNALPNEGAIVTDLGMMYVQIPVAWDNPRLEDIELFFKVMQSCDRLLVWVHCAKNMRVSCFIYLWQKYALQLPEERASYPMSQIWQPTGVWQQFIQRAEAFLNDSELCSL